MINPVCPLCHEDLLPGQRRVSWFDWDGFVTERGAVHLECLRA